MAAAFVAVRGTFDGHTSESNAGATASLLAEVGAYVLGKRYDAAQVETELSGRADGNRAQISYSLLGGEMYSWVDERSTGKIELKGVENIPTKPVYYQATFPVFGYPLTVEFTVATKLGVDYDLVVDYGKVLAAVSPMMKIDATMNAYMEFYLGSAGARGRLSLVDFKPRLHGAAFVTKSGNRLAVRTVVGGTIDVDLLRGRLSALVNFGWAWFSTTAEWEFFDFPGYRYSFPVAKASEGIES